ITLRLISAACLYSGASPATPPTTSGLSSRRYLPFNMRISPNVLFVEDDPDTRELMAIILKSEDYQVMLAANYDEALLLARVLRFDLFIMDNWMPGGSGIDLCKKLREFNVTTPIIFYSGAAYERDKREAFDSGAQAYLTKPTDT